MFASFALLVSPHVLAQLSPMKISVEVMSKTSPPDPKSKEVTGKRSLFITVRNQSNKPIESATLKYYIFGNDLSEAGKKAEERITYILVSREESLDLAPFSSMVITSSTANLRFSQPRWENQSGKNVLRPGSGKAYLGYGVEVAKDGKNIAELFEPKDLKTKVADAFKAN
jgi:hypothetical protein